MCVRARARVCVGEAADRHGQQGNKESYLFVCACVSVVVYGSNGLL